MEEEEEELLEFAVEGGGAAVVAGGVCRRVDRSSERFACGGEREVVFKFSFLLGSGMFV